MVSMIAALMRSLTPPPRNGSPRGNRGRGVLLMFSRLRLPALLAVLAVALPSVFLLSGGAVHAQDGLPPIADVRDLSLSGEWGGSSHSPYPVFTVTNNSTVAMHNVRVQFTTEPASALRRMQAFQSFHNIPREEGYAASSSSGIWTLDLIEPGQEQTIRFNINNAPASQLFQLRAELIGSEPAESAGLQSDIQTAVWVYHRPGRRGFYGEKQFRPVAPTELFVSRAAADAEDRPVFTVTVKSRAASIISGGTRFNQEGVVVKVALSEGLEFASTPSASSGAGYFSRTSSTTGVWRLGSGEIDLDEHTLRVPTRFSAPAEAAPPLNRRCLTAQVVAGNPPITSVERAGPRTTCLETQGATVISESGLRVAIHPGSCNEETRARGTCRADETSDTTPLHVLEYPNRFNVEDSYRPEEAVFLIDPTPLETPLTIVDGGRDWYWATGHYLKLSLAQHGSVGDLSIPGLHLERQVPPNTVAKSRKFTISDVTPKQRPGAIAIVDRWYNRNDGIKRFEALNPDKPDKMTDNILDTWGSAFKHQVFFGAPGVYKVKLGTEWTRKADDVTISKSGVFTFVVGDLLDLQVHDAGLHGALPRGQRAYTLRAENNSDDNARQVEVTLSGVPRGARAVVSSDGGRYNQGACEDNGLCTGAWTIGGLESRDRRYNTGRSDGPTLTLLVEGSPDPITATIATKQTNTVTAGGQSYTYTPVDPVSSNSMNVKVSAGTGRGEPDPEEIKTLRVARLGSTALLRWEPVETVSRWPVAYYQVERDNRVLDVQVKETLYLDMRDSGGNSVYRVRAVSDQGIHGPWSSPTTRGEVKKRQPPDPVTGLTATAGDGAVDLEWNAVRSDGQEIIWQLWRIDDPTWREVFPRAVGSSNLGYTVTELANGVEYVFRVRAVTPDEDLGDLISVASDMVPATPTATLGQQSPPPPGQAPPPSGPNNPPEFDRDSVWYPETPWCANAGARRGTEVARFSATDPDGDSLQYFQRTGFEEIADAYFTVTTVTVGNVDYGVVRVSRTLPADLSPEDGFIIIDLEVIDGRGGLDQIGLSIQYDSSGGSCR